MLCTKSKIVECWSRMLATQWNRGVPADTIHHADNINRQLVDCLLSCLKTKLIKASERTSEKCNYARQS